MGEGACGCCFSLVDFFRKKKNTQAQEQIDLEARGETQASNQVCPSLDFLTGTAVA
jgi:hypothetical protein